MPNLKVSPESALHNCQAFCITRLMQLFSSLLKALTDALNMRTRLRLMELNRAVCLECPEFQVPWFHERYCQQFQKRGEKMHFSDPKVIFVIVYKSLYNLFCLTKSSSGNGTVSPAQQQIHKMLGEVLGGTNCVRAAVVTPYFYTIGEQ